MLSGGKGGRGGEGGRGGRGFMGSHRATPPHDGCGVGVSGEGIKRWGIEGIRIGTSDRFGRGRGEYRVLNHYKY